MSGARTGASMPSASAWSDEAGRTSMPAAEARARAVAIPIRRPVKLPGPTPTATASRSS